MFGYRGHVIAAAIQCCGKNRVDVQEQIVARTIRAQLDTVLIL
jgi:hypothetical protein